MPARHRIRNTARFEARNPSGASFAEDNYAIPVFLTRRLYEESFRPGIVSRIDSGLDRWTISIMMNPDT